MSDSGEPSLLDVVRQRAGDRCEYCRMHQSLQGATFHIEHIRPRSRGGETAAENLAWACPQCNLHKSNRVQVPDPDDGRFVPLFDPRRHSWAEHFRWEEATIVALTAVGRGTVAALNLNHPRRLKIRQAEAIFKLFPPNE